VDQSCEDVVPIGEGTSDVFVRYDQIIEVRKNLSP
jgi:hypothetical protein